MRHFSRPACALALTVVFGLIAQTASAQWTNSLKPQGAPAAAVELVKDGNPTCGIQLSAQSTEREKRAVEELQNWIEQMTGARPQVGYATRPYPSAGASYELELYLAVDHCDGLDRGFYHHDAGTHSR